MYIYEMGLYKSTQWLNRPHHQKAQIGTALDTASLQAIIDYDYVKTQNTVS